MRKYWFSSILNIPYVYIKYFVKNKLPKYIQLLRNIKQIYKNTVFIAKPLRRFEKYVIMKKSVSNEVNNKIGGINEQERKMSEIQS